MEGSRGQQLGRGGGHCCPQSPADLLLCFLEIPQGPFTKSPFIYTHSSGFQFFVRRTPRLQREMRRAQLLVCLLVCPGLGIFSLCCIFRVSAIGEGQSRDTCLWCNLSPVFFFFFLFVMQVLTSALLAEASISKRYPSIS